MHFFLKSILLFLLFTFCSLLSRAQVLKFEELISNFTSPEYPIVFYDTIESKGFVRIDKQYPNNCERVMYYYERNGKPVIFANPQHCLEEYRNLYYPLKAKRQIELQFQRMARPDFDKLNAVIRKSCKLISGNPEPAAAKKGKGKKPAVNKPKAYQHEASGIKLVVCDFYPVSYIFLLK
jgi:hypothetical protein